MNVTGGAASTLYEPLKPSRREIRVVHLNPSESFTGPVQCHLETVSLYSEQKPQYEAISYVWAERHGNGSIIIDGTLVRDIPASAINVLRHFRLPNKVRKLWIDAICINQSDVDERNSQVAIMSKIYRNTEQTLIWLGDEDDQTDSAFLYLHILSTGVFPLLMGPHLIPRKDVNPSKCIESFGIRDFGPLVDFFSRAWFKRVWVLQECLLAPQCTCRCGSKEIDWLHVLRAVNCLNRKQPGLETTGPTGSGRNKVELRIPTECFIQVLHGTHEPSHATITSMYRTIRALESTDSQDKFYAIHGLTTVSTLSTRDQVALGLNIDYKRSSSLTFENATRYALTERYGLELLLDVEPRLTDAKSSDRLQCPSWLPDWSGRQGHGRVIRGNRPLYNDQPDIDLIKADIGTGRLKLKGFDLDQVAHVFAMLGYPERSMEPESASKTTAFVREHTFDIISLFQACREYIIEPGHLVAKEMLRTMLMEAGMASSFGEISEEFWSSALDLREILFTNDHVLTQQQHLNHSEAVPDLTSSDWTSYCETYELYATGTDLVSPLRFIEIIAQNCLDRRLFVTHSGFIGLGSRYIEVGDKLVVFQGCDLPSALRPVAKDTSYANGKLIPESI